MLATAGDLVFHGDMNRRFRAFDAATGKKLWESVLGGNVSVSTITYAVNGKQYVAVMTGNNPKVPELNAEVPEIQNPTRLQFSLCLCTPVNQAFSPAINGPTMRLTFLLILTALSAVAQKDADWPTYNRDLASSRFSPADADQSGERRQAVASLVI